MSWRRMRLEVNEHRVRKYLDTYTANIHTIVPECVCAQSQTHTYTTLYKYVPYIGTGEFSATNLCENIQQNSAHKMHVYSAATLHTHTHIT